MAKILSSRSYEDEETVSLLETLQELSFIMLDHLGIDDEPAEDIDGAMAQIEEGTMRLIEKDQTLETSYSVLMSRFLQAQLANETLVRELKVASALLEAMSRSPWQEDLVDKAMKTLAREGEAFPDGDRLSFKEDDLREALREVIVEYNHHLAEGVLSGRIKP